MAITICQGCAASVEGVIAVCGNCGSLDVEHLAELAGGEAVYACGFCRHTRLLSPAENPAAAHTQFGRIRNGATLRLPLTVWNTVFKCEACRYWNWVTNDDRILGFELECPDCGAPAIIETLGRHWELSKEFFQPIVLGELRLARQPIKLTCGHGLYLPTLILEGKATGTAPPPPTPAPTAAAQPLAEKKKTQPLPILPFPK